MEFRIREFATQVTAFFLAFFITFGTFCFLFQQTLILPDDVDKDKIDAKVNDGVLTIELPKRTPEDKEKAAKVI